VNQFSQHAETPARRPIVFLALCAMLLLSLSGGCTSYYGHVDIAATRTPPGSEPGLGDESQSKWRRWPGEEQDALASNDEVAAASDNDGTVAVMDIAPAPDNLDELIDELDTLVDADDESTGDSTGAADKPRQIDGDGWYHMLEVGDQETVGAYVWHHDRLDGLLTAGDDGRAELQRMALSDDESVAAAGVIGLVRLGDGSLYPRLAEIVAQPGLSIPLRQAAIETLARDSDSSARAQLEFLLADFQQLPSDRQTADTLALRHKLSEALGGAAPAPLAANSVPTPAPSPVQATSGGDDRTESGRAEWTSVAQRTATPPASRPQAAGNNQYSSVEGLRSAEINQRRQAAAVLASQASRQKSSPPTVDRLLEIAAGETDALVWRSLLEATGPDDGESATRLLTLACTHPSVDVRREAVTHLGGKSDARSAALLVSLLDDADTTVVRTAVQAMGQRGTHADVESLKRFLEAADSSLRVDAAVTLARVGSASGPAALERLSYDPDVSTRQQVAVGIGSLGDQRFSPTLIRLLDDEPAVRQAALDSLARVAEGSVGPANATDVDDLERLAQRWKDWYRQQSNNPE
jgi:HEAT repeat protein